MLLPLLTMVLAQASVPAPIPVTGNQTIDTAIYSLLAFLGLKEGKDMWKDYKGKRGGNRQLQELTHAVAKSIEVQGATVTTIRDLTDAVDKMHNQLTEVRVQIAGIKSP